MSVHSLCCRLRYPTKYWMVIDLIDETRVVSIDSSTRKTGMGLFINGVLEKYQLIDLSSNREDTNTRMNVMGKNILLLLSAWQPTIIYIEEPKGEGRNVELVRKLSEIIGVVRAWSIENHCYMEEVKPSEWRKQLGFRQGAGIKREEMKQQSMDYVLRTYGVDVNDDVADAICIGSAMVIKWGKEKQG